MESRRSTASPQFGYLSLPLIGLRRSLILRPSRSEQHTLSAILTLNDNALELPRDLSNLQIHCLYVHADCQRQGLGQRLIENAVKLAQMRHLNVIVVKSHGSAVSYFDKQGSRLTPLIDEVFDYPYRLVRSII